MSAVGSVVTVAHDAVVPSVVRYLPALLVWLGSASTAPQDETVPFVVRYFPALPVWLGTTYVVESVATRVLLEGMLVPLMDVAVATPISGVVRVGLACITNVEPVPVCDATAVAAPTEVIGPVKLLGATVTVSTYPLVAASVDVVGVPRDVILLVPILRAPVIVLPDLRTTVSEKFAVSAKAAAISLSVSRVDGAPSIRLLIAVPTYAVVAI
jgi:hypothetical protein